MTRGAVVTETTDANDGDDSDPAQSPSEDYERDASGRVVYAARGFFYDGVRPSYGLFVRYAKDVALTDCSLGIASGDRDVSDGRPAIVADDVEGLTLRRVRVTDGRAPCQLQTRNSSGDWADGGQMPACAWSPAPARREEDEARVRSGSRIVLLHIA